MIHYQDERVTLHHGDALEVLRALPDASVDSVVTDPPYELGFMGKAWDGQGIAYRVELWAECLRVLKPGGHLLAFGGTRTWHRMVCAIEDAGFEVRDSIAWLYGSGFPESLDVSKAIDKAAGAERTERIGPSYKVPNARAVNPHFIAIADKRDDLPTEIDYAPTAPATSDATRWQGWGTALKPAHEPVCVARKPLIGTVAANVLAHGTGALNIDATRIGMSDGDRAKIESATWVGRNLDRTAYGNYKSDGTDLSMQTHAAGRWPANVVLDDFTADLVDQQSGERPGGQFPTTRGASVATAFASGRHPGDSQARSMGDSGGASRFFYVAKAPAKERPKVDGTAHPTVKPLALMRWLVRLVTPPGGTVLEPFAGSGTTVEACLLEGVRVVAIEREADYLPLIEARIARQADQQLALDA